MFTSGELWKAIILTTVLLAVILLAVALNQFLLEPRRRRKKINQRLTDSDEYLRRAQILKDRSKDQQGWALIILKRLVGHERLAKLQTLMLQADVYQNPGQFWIIALLIDCAGVLISYLAFRSILATLLCGAALGALPILYLKWQRKLKTARFEAQMPDAMELLARSMRAGHTLPSAMELLGEEMGDPMGTEMKIAYEEQRFGISVSETLFHMMQRVESMDLRYFVSAVLIQQETGGNLAELTENIAQVVRGRLNFRSKVRALSASGRISALIMIATPVVAFLGLMMLAPHYEKVLVSSSMGLKMLTVGIIMSLLGAYLLRKMVRSLET